MATNDLLPFSVGAGSNVMSPADYLASSTRSTGFQNGVADATIANRALRQACFAAAALGLFAAGNSGHDTKDDGDVETFADNIEAAVAQLALAGGGQKVRYGIDTSVTANTITATVSPVATSLADGDIYEITVKNTTTITTPVMNISGIGAKSIVRPDGSSLLVGELVAGGKQLFAWDGYLSKFVLLSPTKRYIDQMIANSVSDVTISLPSIISYVVPTFSGSANALAGDASPIAPANLTTGAIIIGAIGLTNTGAATMRLSGGSIYDIVMSDGTTAIAAGRLIIGHVVLFRFDGSKIRALIDLTSGSVFAVATTTAVRNGILAAWGRRGGGYPTGPSINIADIKIAGAVCTVAFTTPIDTTNYDVMGFDTVAASGGKMSLSYIISVSAKKTSGFTMQMGFYSDPEGGSGDPGSSGGGTVSAIYPPNFMVIG